MERCFDMSTATVPPRQPTPKIESKPDTTQLISKGVRARPLFDPEILRRATKESFVKMNPRAVAKNPVMFVVEVGAALTTLFVIKDAVTGAGGLLFGIQIALWLWFTVLFANFAEEWRKRAEKHKLIICARRKPTRSRRSFYPTVGSRWCRLPGY